MTDLSSTERRWSGRHRGWAGLLLALAVIATGAVAYNAGVHEGTAQAALVSAQTPPATPGAPPASPYPYPPYPDHYRHRPWGFGLFSPLLFLVFWFVVLRAVIWGGPWRRHGYRMAGPGWVDCADEWHRQAHERMSEGPSAGGPPHSERA